MVLRLARGGLVFEVRLRWAGIGYVVLRLGRGGLVSEVPLQGAVELVAQVVGQMMAVGM